MPKGHPIIKTNSKGEVPISPFDIQNFKKFYEGTIFTNFYGDRYIILKYFNAGSVLIEFLDEFHYRTNTKLSVIKTGNVKNPFHKMMHGNYVGVGIYGRKSDKVVYNVWHHMCERCNTEFVYNCTVTNIMSYEHVTVSPEWLCFQTFAQWYYDYIEKLNPKYKYNLDKDIYQWGKKYKTYGPFTACLIPTEINNNLLSGLHYSNHINKLPLGVKFSGRKFYSELEIGASRIHLGTFDTPEDAFNAYKDYKESYIKKRSLFYLNEGAILPEVYNMICNNVKIFPYYENYYKEN